MEMMTDVGFNRSSLLGAESPSLGMCRVTFSDFT